MQEIRNKLLWNATAEDVTEADPCCHHTDERWPKSTGSGSPHHAFCWRLPDSYMQWVLQWIVFTCTHLSYEIFVITQLAC